MLLRYRRGQNINLVNHLYVLRGYSYDYIRLLFVFAVSNAINVRTIITTEFVDLKMELRLIYSPCLFSFSQTRTLPSNTSPFRRWGQSSFRSRVPDNSQTHITQRRPSSLVASETDVYTKVI